MEKCITIGSHTQGRFTRLKTALQRGDSFASFARSEGITPQALMNWLDRRPDYAVQVARYRRPGRSAPVTGQWFWLRVEAIRERKRGARWKAAARPLGINWTALCAWYRDNRAAVDRAIEELEHRRAA
jgi:hypothetical protein